MPILPYFEDDFVTLYQGDFRAVLQALPNLRADHLITDPPYSTRCHTGYKDRQREGIDYGPLTPRDVHGLISSVGTRVDGWMACMCDPDLIPDYWAAYDAQQRVRFMPVPCVLRGMNVRRSGDGPSSWAVYLMVARPKALRRWGVLPGAYHGPTLDQGERRGERLVVGAKPEWLMQEIIRDYSRPGETILDPFAGGCTTGVAARTMGRKAVLIEQREDVCERAAERLRAAGRQLCLLG